ncbi:MAG: protein translocase subunit SecD [Deltaproteobacteria bacterium]|nr:protein translocase subunit SecD [Deltaproteobacteria bacterium]
MDGITRARVLAIAASVLIPIYVLLPTFLSGSAEDRFNDAVSGVEVGADAGPSHLVIDLDVVSGDTDALVAAIKGRLDRAGVSYENVVLDDSGRLLVQLRVGASRDDVYTLIQSKADLGLYVGDSLLAAYQGTPEAQLEALRAELVGKPAPGGLPPVAVTAGEAADATTVRLSLDLPFTPLEEGAEPPLSHLLVVRGGVVEQVRMVQPGAEGVPATLTVAQRDDQAGFLAALLGGPLPGQVALHQEKVVDSGPAKAVEEAAPSAVPAWFLKLLPNTAINMGIDLRGGIDLTLQVELDEAVLSQVARDLAYVSDSAAREGIEITSARRSRYEPWILLESPSSFEDLKTFVHTRMPSYYYLESKQEDGHEVHVFSLKDDEVTRIEKQAVEQVLETLRKRVDETGVKEPSIVQKGGGKINVQLPGEVDFQQAVDAIGTTAILEFRMVDEAFDQAELQRMLVEAKDSLPPGQYEDDKLVNDWLYQTGRLKEDHVVMWQYEDGPEGTRVRDYAYPLMAEVILTGGDVNKASTSWDQQQQPYVSLEFKPRGANVFCRVTGESVGKRFAIVLDGEVRSAPNIKDRICGGRASITMGQSMDAMEDSQILALVLRTGSLNAPVSIGEVRQLGSSLGEDAIRSGLEATFIGGLVVFLFMAVWYRTAGIIADIALGINLLMVMALLAIFGATLTLPGFAGLALTIGMAVDANIIIYERIREELRLGQAPRKAVDAGFEKAAVAVLDSNITTAIAGVVLYSYGTGPIKGFAVTLLIGIATTLFTALFVSRTMMELVTRSSTARLRI